MSNHKLDEQQIYDVVLSLTGPIRTVGAAHIDTERLANLKHLCGVVDSLVSEIDAVSCEIDSHMCSVKRSADYASKFMKESLGIPDET